jgi:hypothetical protein
LKLWTESGSSQKHRETSVKIDTLGVKVPLEEDKAFRIRGTSAFAREQDGSAKSRG